jgi:hypothetical protein
MPHSSAATTSSGRLAGARRAAYGSTDDEPGSHFIGSLGEVDPDELFESGRAMSDR